MGEPISFGVWLFCFGLLKGELEQTTLRIAKGPTNDGGKSRLSTLSMTAGSCPHSFPLSLPHLTRVPSYKHSGLFESGRFFLEDRSQVPPNESPVIGGCLRHANEVDKKRATRPCCLGPEEEVRDGGGNGGRRRRERCWTCQSLGIFPGRSRPIRL